MKHCVKKFLALLLALAMVCALAACAAPSNTDEPALTDKPAETESPAQTEAPAETPDPADVDGELILDHEEELLYAEQFTMTRYQGGYTMFTAACHPDKEFLIVPEGKSVPADLADNVVVLQQPLNKITMCSTGMVSLIDAINGLDNIATVGTDVSGWYLDNVIAKLENGEIKFSGKYREPDFEMLTAEGIQLEIDTTMIEGYPEVLAKYDELGIPYLIESSSREGHPLGRVEWVKLFGAIMGMDEEAAAYFNEQAEKVEAVTSADKTDKTAAMFYISSSSGEVYARNGGDYMAQMIGMAGGNYIMADVNPEKTGNLNTTFEDVYARCIDADYLFYVNFAQKFNSIADMIEYNPLFADFKAVKDGNVFVTAPHFTQSTAAIAGIIEDMHKLFNDPAAETTTLLKLS